MVGERAKGLGLVVENEPGVYEPTGEEFPKDLIDFLIFYKLLVILCKLFIAKFDEGKFKKIEKECQDRYDDLKKLVDTAAMKVNNLKKVAESFAEDLTIEETV